MFTRRRPLSRALETHPFAPSGWSSGRIATPLLPMIAQQGGFAQYALALFLNRDIEVVEFTSGVP